MVDISQYEVYINGTLLDPQPSYNGGLEWNEMDIQTADSGRMEDGSMDMEVVAKKVKLLFSFPPMTPSQASAILQLIDDTYMEVEYFDPKLNSRTTKTFYKGDRAVPWYSYTIQQPYSKLTFNLIEK